MYISYFVFMHKKIHNIYVYVWEEIFCNIFSIALKNVLIAILLFKCPIQNIWFPFQYH